MRCELHQGRVQEGRLPGQGLQGVEDREASQGQGQGVPAVPEVPRDGRRDQLSQVSQAKSAADVNMEIPVLVRSPKSSILSSTSFLLLFYLQYEI